MRSRASLTNVSAVIQELPYPFHRIRIVGQPLTAYMQWELRSLVHSDKAGELVRVVDVKSATDDRLLWPELVTVGPNVLYQVIYTNEGSLTGTRKWSDETIGGIFATNSQFGATGFRLGSENAMM